MSARVSTVLVFCCCHISQQLSVSVKPLLGLRAPVCLSALPHPPSPPTFPSGSIPGYFPIRMCSLFWVRVCLLPLTLSSSHTGCLTAHSTTFCMKALVSTFTPLTETHALLFFLCMSHLYTSLCCAVSKLPDTCH